MSLFQCEKCGCIENTALGWYNWNRGAGDDYDGKKLCSACGPSKLLDGSKTEFGKWHEKFKRVFHFLGTVYTDKNGCARSKYTDEIVIISNTQDKEPDVTLADDEG